MLASPPPRLSEVTKSAAGGTVVTVARTFDEVERLRGIWNALSMTDIDSEIDYFLTVVRQASQVINPYVVHIRQPGGPDLMIVARLENLPVPFRLGYRTFGHATLRAIVVTFGGVLGAASQADEERVMNQLRLALERGEADLILMRNVDVGSSLHAAALASPTWWSRPVAQPVSRRWLAVIPDTLEKFLETRSSKTRSTFRRQARQLQETFSEHMRLRRFSRKEEFEELCDAMESVASRTYQRGLGVGYSGTPMQRALIELGLTQGRYRTWMLYLNERPVAFWGGFAFADTFFIGTPAFDPEHMKDSVGTFTMLRMVEELCADPAIKQLDFGHGEADYKSAFGYCARLESDVLIAAPRLWPRLVMFGVSTTSLTNDWMRRFVEKSAWAKRLKARWRNAKVKD